MKKRLIVPMAIMLMLGFCAPSTYLRWGDVLYKTSGDAELNDVNVTRTMKDGSVITLKLGSSSHKEAQANLMAMEALKNAIEKIPARR